LADTCLTDVTVAKTDVVGSINTTTTNAMVIGFQEVVSSSAITGPIVEIEGTKFLPTVLGLTPVNTGTFLEKVTPRFSQGVTDVSSSSVSVISDVTKSNGGATASGSTTNFACGPNARADGGAGTNTAIGAEADARGAGGSNTATGYKANASGLGSSNVATGVEAKAFGDNSANTATGNLADASGSNSSNTAAGKRADARGDNSGNTAIGVDAKAFGSRSSNLATGDQADASGDDSRNVASGFRAKAFGSNGSNVAIGDQADASGDGMRNTAVGAGSIATGANSAAFGAGAKATHANSSAFGNGATTTRENQQVFGTGSSTYTMAGLASDASRTAQGAPAHLVTSNAAGDLAAHTPAQLGLATTGDLARLNDQIRRNAEGVALAMAMAGVPTLMAAENFALTANWGTFEGEHGFAAGFALRLDQQVQFNGGVAYGPNQSTVGARAGIRVGW
jgi:hypothetical protein